jgi:hypothetical protein
MTNPVNFAAGARQQGIEWEPPHNGTATSKAAAQSIKDSRVRLLTKIYTFIEARAHLRRDP